MIIQFDQTNHSKPFFPCNFAGCRIEHPVRFYYSQSNRFTRWGLDILSTFEILSVKPVFPLIWHSTSYGLSMPTGTSRFIHHGCTELQCKVLEFFDNRPHHVDMKLVQHKKGSHVERKTVFQWRQTCCFNPKNTLWICRSMPFLDTVNSQKSRDLLYQFNNFPVF